MSTLIVPKCIIKSPTCSPESAAGEEGTTELTRAKALLDLKAVVVVVVSGDDDDFDEREMSDVNCCVCECTSEDRNVVVEGKGEVVDDGAAGELF